MSQLPYGLYELLKTADLASALAQVNAHAQLEDLSLEAGARHLAHALTEQISDLLLEVASEKGNAQDLLSRQVELLNQLMVHARQIANSHRVDNPIANPPQVLRSVAPVNQPMEIPAIGLAQPWLFTSGKDSPALLHELQSELASCDRVDILVSFITVSGVRKIIDTLKAITALDAKGKSRTQLRFACSTV